MQPWPGKPVNWGRLRAFTQVSESSRKSKEGQRCRMSPRMTVMVPRSLCRYTFSSRAHPES